MHKSISLTLLAALLLGSCAPAQTTSTQPPFDQTQTAPATATQTVLPSRTPIPTQTIIPTSTPYPPLQTDGPYLLYSTDWNNLTILDADGKGKQTFQLPNDGFVRDLQEAVSPDGKWLAYFTGTGIREPYNLALHLLNLENQMTIPIARLIAPGFPENLEPVKTSDPAELESCTSGPCRISIIELAFNEGIQSMDWSPDGEYLAFAAQIDGPSSDVYLFSMQNKSVRRLVSDLENVWWMEWSPNGKTILYQNSTAGLTYTSRYIYVANPQNENVQTPQAIYGGLFWNDHGWINENSYLISSGGEGAPPHKIRYINTDTLQVREIWTHEAQYVSVDRENGYVILASRDDTDVGTIHIVSTNGNYTKISDGFYYLFKEQGMPNIYFGLSWLANETDQLVSIYLNGSVTHMDRIVSYGQAPVVSPDKKSIIVVSDTGVELYDADLDLIKSADLYPEEVIWTPDSTAVFLIRSRETYYWVIQDEGPLKINLCDDCYPFDYVWLP